MIQPKLSILVAGCLKRMKTSGVALADVLLRQSAGTPDVEVLWLLDDQKVSTGMKRQRLMDMARGEYITFVDDDDLVEADYAISILQEIGATDEPPDLITFMVRYYENGQHQFDQDFSLDYPHPHDDKMPLRLGSPSHTMAWKRSLVRDIPFEDRYYSEDRFWVDIAMKRARNERKIGRVLYHYRHIGSNSDHLVLQAALDADRNVHASIATAATGLPPARPPRKDGRPHKVGSSQLQRDRRSWWEREHQTGGFKDGAGSTPGEVIDALGIRPLLMGAPKGIIEIGVGSGKLVEHLASLGHRCYGVDISETARERISGFARALEPDDAWPQCDLIISYLCLQHMPDDEVARMLEKCFQSLTPNGMLAAQYAFLTEGTQAWFLQEVASGFNFVRPPEVMQAMVEAASGRIINQRVVQPAPGVGWALMQAEPRT